MWSEYTHLDPRGNLLRAQLHSVFSGFPATLAAGPVVGACLCWTVRYVPNINAVIGALALHVAIGGMVLVRSTRLRRRDWSVDDAPGYIKLVVMEAAAVAWGWFVFLSIAGVHAQGEELILITTAMAEVSPTSAMTPFVAQSLVPSSR